MLLALHQTYKDRTGKRWHVDQIRDTKVILLLARLPDGSYSKAWVPNTHPVLVSAVQNADERQWLTTDGYWSNNPEAACACDLVECCQ